MQIITPITIDLINPYPLLNFNLKQGDSGRGILVTVTANGANVEFTTETVNIYVKKPDGTIIYNACTVSGNQVRAMFTNQALAVAGNAQVELEIISQDDTISTPIARIDILPTNIDSEAIESSNEFTALTEALNSVAGSVSSANKATQAANTAAASANAAAKAANDIAEEVQEKLENGDFVGPQGPPGSIEKVTGAASTIVNDNLTANMVLVSDGSGKVAASGVTSTELGYLDGVSSGIQGQLNGKQGTVTGGASTITGSNLTANRALVSNGSGKVAVSAVTSTELGYLDGVTSGIQGQINSLSNKLNEKMDARLHENGILNKDAKSFTLENSKHYLVCLNSAASKGIVAILSTYGNNVNRNIISNTSDESGTGTALGIVTNPTGLTIGLYSRNYTSTYSIDEL